MTLVLTILIAPMVFMVVYMPAYILVRYILVLPEAPIPQAKLSGTSKSWFRRNLKPLSFIDLSRCASCGRRLPNNTVCSCIPL